VITSATILSGMKQERANPKEIEGKQALFVVNLPPRKNERGDFRRYVVRHRVCGRIGSSASESRETNRRRSKSRMSTPGATSFEAIAASEEQHQTGDLQKRCRLPRSAVTAFGFTPSAGEESILDLYGWPRSRRHRALSPRTSVAAIS